MCLTLTCNLIVEQVPIVQKTCFYREIGRVWFALYFLNKVCGFVWLKEHPFNFLVGAANWLNMENCTSVAVTTFSLWSWYSWSSSYNSHMLQIKLFHVHLVGIITLDSY